MLVEIGQNDNLDTGSFRIQADVHTGGDAGHGIGAGVRLLTDDGRNYPLSVGPTVIGRGDQASVRIADVNASRQHARLDYDGQRVTLTDLGSANGSLVNGRRVTEVALNPGDVIQIGSTRLTFRTDGAAEPTRINATYLATMLPCSSTTTVLQYLSHLSPTYFGSLSAGYRT